MNVDDRAYSIDKMRVAGKVTQDVCYERFMYPQGAMRDSISMS